MIGLMINPDPFEGTEEFVGMGEEAWYPLYEKMVELDVPALIHSATTKKAYDYYQNYFITTETSCILQMVEKRVFNTFPNLKIIVSHGGGSIPYQIGRWRSNFGRMMGLDFDEELKKFYFDTVLYNQEALELLFKTVGTDRCMFGTENPGTGTWFDPKKGRLLDDIKPDIDAIDLADRPGPQEHLRRHRAQGVHPLQGQPLSGNNAAKRGPGESAGASFLCLRTSVVKYATGL